MISFFLNLRSTDNLSNKSIAPRNNETKVQKPRKKLSKEYIKNMINDNVFSTGDVSKRKSKNKSSVWNRIKRVLDENQKDLTGYYFCSICTEIIVNETNSTTPFHRHICVTSKEKGQPAITQYTALLSAKKPTKISAQDQQNLRNGIIQFICSDLRPFNAVEGKGFCAAMSAAIKIGQTYPSLESTEIKKILPSRSTIQRDIESKADVAKENVKVKLKNAFESFGGSACSSDLWSDEYRQRNYIAVTAHIPVLSEKEIKYERYILGVEEVKEIVKTKEVIESHILEMLSTYGFSENDAKLSIYFVTDRGSQFKAMDKFQRANCFAHMLNNIVKATCNDHELKGIISNAKDLVRYIKKAGLNYRSDLRLKSYCETRWSTVYTMLRSIVLKFEEIYKVLEHRQKQNRRYNDCSKYIECLHKSTLSVIVDFLENFKVWTDYIEADKCITIHRVLVDWPQKVMKHLVPTTELDPNISNSNNFKLIEGIKALGREYIRDTMKNDFTPTMEQNIAVALHIRMKKLKKMSPAIREATYQKINDLISTNAVASASEAPPRQSQRTSINLFDSFADSEDEMTNATDTKYCKELEEYLHLSIPDKREYELDDTTQLTQWWFKHKTVFPNLFKLFMRISSIPASSAPSERCFSVTGQIISDRRSCIKPENVENIIMCRNLYQN